MAGNARFHDKFHRKNHHTNPTVGYADSATDPIASPSEPFQGDFVVNGKLSASSGIDILSANIRHDIYCENIHVADVTYTDYISGTSTEVIISDGSLNGNGNNTLTLDFQSGIFSKTPIFNIIGDVSSTSALFIDSNATIKNNLMVSGNGNINGDVNIGTRSANKTLTVFGTISGSETIYGKTFSFNPNISSTTYLFYDTNINGPTIQMNGISGSYIDISPTLQDTVPGGLGDYGLRLGSWYNILSSKYINFIHSNKNDLSILVSNSTRMVVTTAGNVGIGTITPVSRLQVEGDIRIKNGSYLYLSDVSDQTRIRRDTSNNGIDIQTNNVSRLFVSDNGNVGIGTVTPNEELTVNGVISSNNFIYSQDVTLNRGDSNREGGQLTFNKSYDNSNAFGIDVYTDSIGAISSRLRFIDMVASQERATMLSSGNFGLGTVNPTQKLHVEGNVYTNGNINTDGNINVNGNINATGNLFIQGNLSALGDVSIIDTNIISTSSLSVINYGTTEGLLVNQIGNYTIAKFQQDGTNSVVITKDTVTVSNTLTGLGYIGSPNINLLEKTSTNWDTAYNTVCSTSSQWMTGGDKDFKVRNLNVTNQLAVSGIKVTRSLYYPISNFIATGNINLDTNSPTYLFIDTNGSSLTLTLPDVRPEDVGLTFFIKNNYGGSTLVSQITAKNYTGATEVVLDKKGVIPNNIQIIWDGLEWQQISIA